MLLSGKIYIPRPPPPQRDMFTPSTTSLLQPVSGLEDTCIRSKDSAKQNIRSGVALHQGTQVPKLDSRGGPQTANREPDPKCILPLRRSSGGQDPILARRGLILL